jgi:Mrp family chromosome partitioning ATPase
MTEQASDGLSLHAYLRILARWKRLVIAVAVVVTALGVAYTWTQTPMYSSAAQLIYLKQIDIGDPLGQSYIDRTAQQAEIESVPAVIKSTQVRKDAQALMSESTLKAGYSVSAELTPGVQDAYSNVVAIVAMSPSPEAAADAANAYADAFLAWGRETSRGQVTQAIDVVESQIESLGPGQRDSSEYRALQSNLQQLQLLRASVNGNFRTISAATPPAEPFSPDWQRGIILALVGGLVLGVGLAFVLEQFDTRVRGDDQVKQLLGLPLIGHVPPVPRKSQEVVQTLANPTGPAAEAYRHLRNNLDFANLDDDIRSLMISSSLQGEGKSVIACNLAVSLALAGKHVVLVDADLRGPRVHTYMGVRNAVGLSSVAARKADVKQALVSVALTSSPRQNGSIVMTADVVAGGAGRQRGAPAPGNGRKRAGDDSDWLWPDANGEAPILRVLPSGPLPPNPGEVVASRRFGEIIAELAADADVVLIDTPAVLPVGDTAAMAASVDALVFVVNAGVTKRPALQQARAQLALMPCRKLGFIEVAERSRHTYSGYYSPTDGAARRPSSRPPAKPIEPVHS